jgi:uncharacterized C2H2 Zn-finger protein
MGTYNTILASLACPRCGSVVEAEIDCKFGWAGDMKTLRIGDEYPWVDNRKQFQNGGRPPEGSVDGEGYMECPACGKDAFILVEIRDDVIVSVRPDHSRAGYIP